MSDFIPLEFKASCTQCGAELQVEVLGAEPEPHDRVFCPVHGTVGTRKEVDARIVQQGGEKVAKDIGDHLANTLRDIGWNVKRMGE